jgi:hypothetical protein
VIVEVLLKCAGVIGPALVLTVVVRRFIAAIEWRVALLFLGVTLAFLGRAAFTPDLPVPVDEVARGYPWRGVVGEVEVGNPLPNETVRIILPWMDTVRRELFAGRAPLWNPYSYSGSPLLGSGQSAPFSPFFLATLFVPLPAQLVAIGGLKVFVALLFGYLFLRREGVGAAAAIVGSMLFGCSVFQTVYLYFPLASVTALLPAALFAAGFLLDRPSVRSVILLALVGAAALAGGHPESVAHICIACVLLIGLEVAAHLPRRSPPRWRQVALAVTAALLLAAALAAPVWGTFAEQVLDSHRFSGIGPEGMTPVFPRSAALALLDPDAFGNPARHDWKGFFNYAMVAPSYLGMLALALLPVGLLSPSATRRDRLLVLVAAALFLLALNWTPPAHWLNTTPPLAWIANDRLRFVCVFLAAVVAARSLDRWKTGDVVLAGAGSLAVTGLWAWTHDLGSDLSSYHVAGVAAIAGMWLAWPLLRLLRRPAKGLAAQVAIPFVAAELFIFCVPFNAIADRELYAPPLPIVEEISKHSSSSTEPFRVVGLGWMLTPASSAHYGLEDIRGLDPMALTPYQEFLGLVAVDNPAYNLHLVRRSAQPGLDFLNVRYVLAEPGAKVAGLVRLYSGPDGDLYRNLRMLPRFFAPARLIRRNDEPLVQQLRRISSFRQQVVVEGVSPGSNGPVHSIRTSQPHPGLFEVDVHAPAPTFVASSEPWAAGWQATLGATQLALSRVNGAFLGFSVPEGHSRVVLRYRPQSFAAGLWASLGGVLAIIVALAWPRRRPKPQMPSRGKADPREQPEEPAPMLPAPRTQTRPQR